VEKALLESDEEEHESAAKGADQESEKDAEVQEVAPEDTGARRDPDDDPDDGGDSDEEAAGYNRAAGGGSRGGRFYQDVSVYDGKYLPKVPKKMLPTLNEEQLVLDFYQTFKSQLSRTIGR